ncbi:MAG: hypothetical protein WA947_14225 [Phormidesmis sp.]
MSDYKPVDCALQDKLEAIATLHRTANITYQGEADGSTDTESEVESEIVDIYADSGADYCKLKDGTIIRLDKIKAIAVNGEKIV